MFDSEDIPTFIHLIRPASWRLTTVVIGSTRRVFKSKEHWYNSFVLNPLTLIPGKEPPDVAISKEGKEVFKRFCLIGVGIPVVLFIFITVIYLSPWALKRAEATKGTLNMAAFGLAAAGLAIWAFFSFLLYKRLWNIFPHIAEKEKGWSYAEGTFGLLGVGVSMASVLGVFYYLFTGDYARGAIIIGLSFVLALVEAAMFPNRIADVEQLIGGMD
jgi:hypothetical protein